VLGDQPHLRPGTLDELIGFAQRHPGKICQPGRGGHGRHPVLLPEAVFKQLASTEQQPCKREELSPSPRPSPQAPSGVAPGETRPTLEHGHDPATAPSAGTNDCLSPREHGTLKEFLAAHAALVELAELEDPGLDLDLDTPEDFEKARRMFFG
jgi:CTP:molybdopterin cytidylyltransferase MocA